jgi:hypothetical protein
LIIVITKLFIDEVSILRRPIFDEINFRHGI